MPLKEKHTWAWWVCGLITAAENAVRLKGGSFSSFGDGAQGRAVPGAVTQDGWPSAGLAWLDSSVLRSLHPRNQSEMVLGKKVRKAKLPSPCYFALHFPSCWENLLPPIHGVIVSRVSLFISNQLFILRKRL